MPATIGTSAPRTPSTSATSGAAVAEAALAGRHGVTPGIGFDLLDRRRGKIVGILREKRAQRHFRIETDLAAHTRARSSVDRCHPGRWVMCPASSESSARTDNFVVSAICRSDKPDCSRASRSRAPMFCGAGSVIGPITRSRIWVSARTACSFNKQHGNIRVEAQQCQTQNGGFSPDFAQPPPARCRTRGRTRRWPRRRPPRSARTRPALDALTPPIANTGRSRRATTGARPSVQEQRRPAWTGGGTVPAISSRRRSSPVHGSVLYERLAKSESRPEPPRSADVGHAVLAQMDAVRAGSQRDVEPVVDQHLASDPSRCEGRRRPAGQRRAPRDRVHESARGRCRRRWRLDLLEQHRSPVGVQPRRAVSRSRWRSVTRHRMPGGSPLFVDGRDGCVGQHLREFTDSGEILMTPRPDTAPRTKLFVINRAARAPTRQNSCGPRRPTRGSGGAGARLRAAGRRGADA